jgi:protein-S-isoprenylcysteine O-methyltransferase Ste14
MTGNDLMFRVLLGVIIISFVSHRAYYSRKYQIASEDTDSPPEPEKALRVAGVLAVLGLLGTILYIVNPSLMAWSSIILPEWMRWLGVIIALFGFGLLQRSQDTLGENWSDDPHLMDGHQMVVTGPYKWVRHPIYSSFLLILGSTFFISANWFIGGTWIMMMALDINNRIEVEEQLMISRYGEQYIEYMSSTGRIFPKL